MVNVLKSEIHVNDIKNSFAESDKTFCLSLTKTNWITFFRKTVGVSFVGILRNPSSLWEKWITPVSMLEHEVCIITP